MSEIKSKCEIPSALSLKELIARLEEDPIYGDSRRVENMLEGIPPLANEPFPLLERLIFRVCRLKKYGPGTRIKPEKLRAALRAAKCPLPEFWFPDEPDNTSVIEKGYKRGGEIYDEMQEIKSDFDELKQTKAPTPSEFDLKKRRERELKERLGTLQRELHEENTDEQGVKWVVQKSTFPTEKKRRGIIDWARRCKFIYWANLAVILAADKSTSKCLMRLWNEFQCNRRGPQKPKLNTARNRLGAWIALLERVIFNRVNGRSEGLMEIPLLACNEKGNVQLEHVKEYFSNVLEVPLPEGLFPSEEANPHKSQSKMPFEGRPENRKIFPCPSDTAWEQVRITLLSDDAVRIKTPSGEARFSYHGLGFVDKRKGDKPTALWGLLKILAQNQGTISPQNSEFKSTLLDTTKRLNKHLQGLFGINESIFAGSYRREKAYRSRIMFSDQTITT